MNYGFINDVLAAKLYLLFYKFDQDFAMMCIKSSQWAQEQIENGKDPGEPTMPTGTDEDLPCIEAIDKQFDVLNAFAKSSITPSRVDPREEYLMPNTEVVDKIFRYASNIDRELQHSSKELHVLQERRKNKNASSHLDPIV